VTSELPEVDGNDVLDALNGWRSAEDKTGHLVRVEEILTVMDALAVRPRRTLRLGPEEDSRTIVAFLDALANAARDPRSVSRSMSDARLLDSSGTDI
jgi:hypothetical protein